VLLHQQQEEEQKTALLQHATSRALQQTPHFFSGTKITLQHHNENQTLLIWIYVL
jgi:hypothetical protein